MSETLIWLLYLVGAGLAFAAVRYWRWPLSISMLLPAVVGTLIWYLAVELGKEENEPAWINVDLSMNFSFFLIFAAVGAAIAFYLNSRTDAQRAPDSDQL
jgi:uncharacterized membrane protein YeaQ/YmgE (transglycosylase-associated protein family)